MKNVDSVDQRPDCTFCMDESKMLSGRVKQTIPCKKMALCSGKKYKPRPACSLQRPTGVTTLHFWYFSLHVHGSFVLM